jgi:hypothetical protein
MFKLMMLSLIATLIAILPVVIFNLVGITVVGEILGAILYMFIFAHELRFKDEK